ncbi:hypothetical protein [uncultured Paracoccus sp.]|uniref:hypothetical protein n=1 Tax=uncultured Paracoccus sp. TaxID=189685 RepID=UPI002632B4C3|nr:hypothetical protein [uncultured Paracoccus sp.]
MTVPLQEPGSAAAPADTVQVPSTQPSAGTEEQAGAASLASDDQQIVSTPAETGAPAPAEIAPGALEPAQTEMPASTQEALATPTMADPDASAADAAGVSVNDQQPGPQNANTSPPDASTDPVRDTAATAATTPAAAAGQAPEDEEQQDAAATAEDQAAAARQYASTVQAKSQVGIGLTPEEVAAIAGAPAITPVFLFDQDEGQGDPASAQSSEGADEATVAVAAQDGAGSDGVATAATEPEQENADGTAPGNEGSTGWTGGLGGSMIGTNPAGALPESKTWQPPTARGVDLAG